MSERILRLPEVTARAGLGRSSLYEEIAAGRFPRQLQLTQRSVGWRESEVDAWIASRKSAVEADAQ